MEVRIVPTRNYYTNCYLLYDDTCAVIIDPGEEDERILDFARDNKDKPEKLILLTHCHFDHIEGVGSVKQVWSDAEVVIGKYEVEGLANNTINLSGVLSQKIITVGADRTVDDLDTIKIGNNTFLVFHTPGHTVGSVCYLIDDILFSGDLIFRNSIGRTDFPTSDYKSMTLSLKRVLMLDKEVRVLSGHGMPSTIGYEINNNPFVKFSV